MSLRPAALRTDLSTVEEVAAMAAAVAGLVLYFATEPLGLDPGWRNAGLLLLFGSIFAARALARWHDRRAMRYLRALDGPRRADALASVEDAEQRAELAARLGLGGESRDGRYAYPRAYLWIAVVGCGVIATGMAWLAFLLLRSFGMDPWMRVLAAGCLAVAAFAVWGVVRRWRIDRVRFEADAAGLRASRGAAVRTIPWDEVSDVLVSRRGLRVDDGSGRPVRAHRHLPGVWDLAGTTLARAPATADVRAS